MKQLTKQEYQKRSLAITKLVYYLELNTDRLAKILCELMSPIGEEKHPYRMTDNEFMGYIETKIKQLENGDGEED